MTIARPTSTKTHHSMPDSKPSELDQLRGNQPIDLADQVIDGHYGDLGMSLIDLSLKSGEPQSLAGSNLRSYFHSDTRAVH